MLTGRDIESLSDDSVIIMDGKTLKSIQNLARSIVCGNDKASFHIGCQLTNTICNSTKVSDEKFIELLK